jgi:hypothetical protein
MIRFAINLADPEIGKKKVERRWAYVASAFFVALIGYDLWKWDEVRSTQVAFGERVARVTTEVQKAQADLVHLGRPSAPTLQATMQTEIDAVNDLIRQRHFSWVGFLSNIEKHVSSDISIRRITPAEREDAVMLSGIARTLPDLAAFVDHMQKDGALQEVFLLDQKQIEASEDEPGESLGETRDEPEERLEFSIRFRYRALGKRGEKG